MSGQPLRMQCVGMATLQAELHEECMLTCTLPCERDFSSRAMSGQPLRMQCVGMATLQAELHERLRTITQFAQTNPGILNPGFLKLSRDAFRDPCCTILQRRCPAKLRRALALTWRAAASRPPAAGQLEVSPRLWTSLQISCCHENMLLIQN